jgi:hypothetical protein
LAGGFLHLFSIVILPRFTAHSGEGGDDANMKIVQYLALSLALATTASAAPPPADRWEIGPLIRGKNYSVGMPVTPTPVRGGGWSFQFPYPNLAAGHVHYITYRHGPLTGKKRITMRYRIDAAKGVKFTPREYPAEVAKLSLFFQRRGDTWTAKRKYAQYRWYAPSNTMVPIAAGTYTLSVALDNPDWVPVMGGTARDYPDGLAGAIADTERVGFVMGSDSTRGHGVFATGPAKFTLLDFRVE